MKREMMIAARIVILWAFFPIGMMISGGIAEILLVKGGSIAFHLAVPARKVAASWATIGTMMGLLWLPILCRIEARTRH